MSVKVSGQSIKNSPYIDSLIELRVVLEWKDKKKLKENSLDDELKEELLDKPKEITN